MENSPERQLVSPFDLRFSQRTAGGNSRAQKLRASMRTKGFVDDPDNPVNVVRTPEGLTTIDNTRVAVAQELAIEQIPVVIREFTEPLPAIMIKARRFGEAKTWGEALMHRTQNQRPEPLPPFGTAQRPAMPPDEQE
ncbi:MAG: hypothetical protein SF029_18860 [bacterium]|nr:hypothetical protein [bacterium]